MEGNDQLFRNLSEQDPQQLRQVIEMLIAKSRVLLQNLEDTWEKMDQAQTEKAFWKDSYFNLRESCQQYIDCNGLTPFNYIVSLQEELKKEKVYKSCLEEKFKVMLPGTHSPSKRRPEQGDQSRRYQVASIHEPAGKEMPSTEGKRSGEGTRLQNKHRIGPKSIEFFKFREQRQQ